MESSGGRKLTGLSICTADVIILVFSIVSSMSLDEIQAEFYPFVAEYAPNAPIILVGNKSDLRDDLATIERMAAKHQIPVTQLQAEDIARKLNCVKYIESSALTQRNLRNVFDEALRAVLKKRSERPGVKLDMNITLHEGTVNEAQDSNGLADPYIKIKSGMSTLWSSKVQKKTLKPNWNETATVKLSEVSGKSYSYTVELWDEDTLKDDYIGSTTINGTLRIDSHPAFSHDFKDKKGNIVGTVKFGYSFSEHK